METSFVGQDCGSEDRYGMKVPIEVPVPNWLTAPAEPPMHERYSVPVVGAMNTSACAMNDIDPSNVTKHNTRKGCSGRSFVVRTFRSGVSSSHSSRPNPQPSCR